MLSASQMNYEFYSHLHISRYFCPRGFCPGSCLQLLLNFWLESRAVQTAVRTIAVQTHTKHIHAQLQSRRGIALGSKGTWQSGLEALKLLSH